MITSKLGLWDEFFKKLPKVTADFELNHYQLEVGRL